MKGAQLRFATVEEWRAAWAGEWARWRDQPATRNAMASFDELGGNDLDRCITLERIAEACLHAVRYDPSQDPGVIFRKRMAWQRKRLAELARAATTLAKSCERREEAMMWAISMARDNALQVDFARPHDGRTVEIRDMGAAWFGALANAFKGTMPELHGGPFFYRFTVGNLHFDKPVQAGRPIHVSSMLAFELTLYLRMLTAGRARDVAYAGQRINKDMGNPCSHVVAAFCNAALGTQLDGRQVADRLRRLGRGVKRMPWPEVDKSS